MNNAWLDSYALYILKNKYVAVIAVWKFCTVVLRKIVDDASLNKFMAYSSLDRYSLICYTFNFRKVHVVRHSRQDKNYTAYSL